MSAHTPGPWSAKPICIDSGWVDIASESRYCIGYATPRRNGTPAERSDDETCANAHLISASPRMYNALVKVREFWAGGDCPPELLAEIDAALDQADGRP